MGACTTFDGVSRQRRVAGGATETLGAQECLADAPRPTPRDEMRGPGVPQRGQGGVFGEATRAHHARTGLLAGGRRTRRLLVSRGAPPGPGARTRPADPSPLPGPFGHGHPAVLAPWARSATDPPALRIQVRDRSRPPFPSAQPTRRDQLPTPAGVRAWYPGQPGAHVLRTQHDGPCVAVPGTDALEDGPRALPRALVEALASRQVEASRALRDLLLMAHGEAVLPDRLCTARRGSPPVVWGQVCDGFQIARLSRGGSTPAWQVFAHTASERRHGHPPVRGKSPGAQSSTRIRTRDDRSA